MKRKAGNIFAVLLVFAAFMVFVSEAPAPGNPDMSITKFCTDASAPGEPITFSATIENLNPYQGLVITGCSDDQPGSVINESSSFPITISEYGSPGDSTTITGSYVPTTNPSTDIITCTGYGTVTGDTVTVTRSSNPATCSTPTGGGCTRTPGYWKNHPDAWPVESIEIGGITYTKAQAIALMETPVRGDKRITMFKALVAAKLNALSGADFSCIATTISDADSWMGTYGGSRVPADSEAWKIGEPLYLMLDNYNNGLLCTPHCD